MSEHIKIYEEATRESNEQYFAAYVLFCWIGHNPKFQRRIHSAAMSQFYNRYPSLKSVILDKHKTGPRFVKKHPALFEYDTINNLIICVAGVEAVQPPPAESPESSTVSHVQPVAQQPDTLPSPSPPVAFSTWSPTASKTVAPPSKPTAVKGPRRASAPIASPPPTTFKSAQTRTNLFPEWSNEPNIPEKAIEILNSRIPTLNPGGFCSDVRDELRILGIEKNLISYLIRQRQIGYIEANMDVLWKLKESDPSIIESLVNSSESLVDLAFRYNTTTTELAILLVGREVIAQAVDNVANDNQDKNGATVQLQRANEALVAQQEDMFTSYKLRSNNYETIDYAKVSKSGVGEEYLFDQLRAARISFQTQLQQTALEIESVPAGQRCTPDALLDTPITLFGREIHWIDVKNAVWVPGLSPKEYIRDVNAQVDKYVARFGSGAILWTKGGLCQKMIDASSSEVLHLRANAPIAKKSTKPKHAPRPYRRATPHYRREMFLDMLVPFEFGYEPAVDDVTYVETRTSTGVHTLYGAVGESVTRTRINWSHGKALGSDEIGSLSLFLVVPFGDDDDMPCVLGDPISCRLKIESITETVSLGTDNTLRDLLVFVHRIMNKLNQSDSGAIMPSRYVIKTAQPPVFLLPSDMSKKLSELNVHRNVVTVNFVPGMCDNPQPVQPQPQLQPHPQTQRQLQAQQQQQQRAEMPASDEKTKLGMELYQKVQAKNPQLAPKITGMLIELDLAEIHKLLSSPPALDAKIAEAIQVLQEAQKTA